MATETSQKTGQGAEILWDIHGIPHIFANDEAGLFRAMGWAQMKNHGNLILRLYAQARGRAAELWGRRYLASDRWVATMGIPERAQEWFEVQNPLFRDNLKEFAAGINDYAKAHRELIDEQTRAVLPIEAVDILAHCQRVLNYSFVVDPESVASRMNDERGLGSNAWAISPSRSASGHALLLTNPHMPWGDMFFCFEAHLNAPGINAYGIALVGFPVLVMAFNECLGWSHTVNAYQGWTLYRLDLVPGGYRIDDEVHVFDEKERILRIRQDDGTLSHERLSVRYSLHGPIVESDGKAFALRVAGLSQPRALEQWWNMARATDLAGFETALQDMQVPMFTVLYADRDGHIMHLFNGRVPIRPEGDAEYWAGSVPGDISGNIWTETHPYRDLPCVVDPPSGWLHNANDPPWTTTFPAALNPDDFPRYMAPRGPMSIRAQRSARLLMEHERVSLEDMVRLKYSTVMELADRVLDDLIRAARQSRNPVADAAADVLNTWDRQANTDSRGAVLFIFWLQAMDPDSLFATPWSEDQPLTTPHGLADPADAAAKLEAAAVKIESLYGDLDVKWGDVFRLRSARVNLPAIGADKVGVFSELWFIPTSDNCFAAVGGDCYAAAIEFSSPVRAMVLTIYGNATQPGSTSGDEQLKLFARKQLRPALLTRAEIMASLACREVIAQVPSHQYSSNPDDDVHSGSPARPG